MEAPIIVIRDDLEIFDSVSAAERYLEPADVRTRDTACYDRNGRVLVAEIVARRRLIFAYDAVVLSDVIPQKNNAGELRQLLLEYLRRLGKCDADDARADLDALISKARIWAKCD